MLAIPVAILALALPDSASEAAIAARVEIVRTAYGVPHVMAPDFESFGFAMGWLQSEDYGDVAARALVRGRGHSARFLGHDSIDDDFEAREIHQRAVETLDLVDDATRQVYAGFAAGVNYYVRLHRHDFPTWMPTDFTAVDAHALEVQSWSRGDAAAFVRARRRAAEGRTGADDESSADPAFALDGSNAWAFHPSRTTSGHALLLRNPHLAWSAGYYEAHVRIPGQIDFYGDFRIGGAFGIVGGFNPRLGWATTNNYPKYSQVYELEGDSADSARYRLDGAWHTVEERSVTVDYRTESGGTEEETQVTEWTSLGPVIYRESGRLWVIKDPRDGEYRRGQQFFRMMRASSLTEWLDIMRMRAHPSSNFTYADVDGNIAHLYNARLPLLPHGPTGDTAAFAARTSDAWSTVVPFDELPLYVNPIGGYVQQANDTPDWTNLNVPLDRDTVPANLPEPRLRLRSQLSLSLVHGDRKLSLADMMALKHSPRMLLAERVSDDLIAAIAATAPTGDVARALEVLRAWDRTARADSRGGVLFQTWWNLYEASADTATLYAEPWSLERPTETPRGLGQAEAAVAAFSAAARAMRAAGVPFDTAWGEVHRVVRGRVDAPVSGCEAAMGCFRTLSFSPSEDGRQIADRGDGWILAVEFGTVPTAYSVLAYGESARASSPHFDDQAALFARGEMKRIVFTDEDIARAAVRRYHPGDDETR
jgi:acyl-homoserine-lactone acylase